MMKKKTLKGRGGEGLGGEGWGVKMLHTYIHTDRHRDIQTEPLTKQVLEEHSLLIKITGHLF